MRACPSVELLMQLATQEATSGRFKEIEPGHILAATLKFAELPVEEVDKMAPGSDAAKLLAAEVHAIRQELAGRFIDSKQARRRLRAELGRGNALHVRPPLHRSEASREVFDAATKLVENAGCEALKAQHLLEALLLSPTPVVIKVFGDALRTKTWKPGETPLLERFGRDLTRLAAEGKLPAGRQSRRPSYGRWSRPISWLYC
jgi:ATP-dependent Clp protease ATP-binding subunit ClpA